MIHTGVMSSNGSGSARTRTANFVCLHIQRSTRAVPLGAAMVAARVQQNLGTALQVAVIDGYLGDNPEQNLAEVTAGEPDYICFSIYIWNVRESLDLINRIKSRTQETVVIIGGPQPTALPDYFSKIPAVDYIVRGEAENTTVSLFTSLLGNKEGIPRIIEDTVLPSVNDLPSPYLDGILDLQKYNGALWELSRGCPFQCAFCYESRGHNSIRRFSIERLEQELELFRVQKISEIFVLDPTFNYDKSEAKRLLRIMADTAPEIHYSFEIRAEFLDEEMVDLFSGLYCTLQIGLQSIHPHVLKHINRSFNSRIFNEKVFLLHEARLTYGFDLIFGLPGDTFNGFLESIDFAFALIPNHVDMFPLSVLPGTELYEKKEEHELTFSPENGYSLIKSGTFTEDQMQKASQIAAIADLFYNRGKAVTWFDIILENLEMKPSKFFLALTGQQDIPKDFPSPLEYQTASTGYIFNESQRGDWSPIALCLITYFWYSNSLFDTCPGEQEVTATRALNPYLKMAQFEYDPLEIISFIENGIIDFAFIMEQLEPETVNMIIYELEGEIEHYACTEQEYEVLCKVYHGTHDLNHLTSENREIIDTFISRGIITECKGGEITRTIDPGN